MWAHKIWQTRNIPTTYLWPCVGALLVSYFFLKYVCICVWPHGAWFLTLKKRESGKTQCKIQTWMQLVMCSVCNIITASKIVIRSDKHNCTPLHAYDYIIVTGYSLKFSWTIVLWQCFIVCKYHCQRSSRKKVMDSLEKWKGYMSFLPDYATIIIIADHL